MTLKERTVVLTGVDTDGNTTIDMPITTVENVEGAVKTVDGYAPDASGNIDTKRLPLSGGTMTGTIVSNGYFVRHVADNGVIAIRGGTDSTSSGILIYGKDHSTNSGAFAIQAINSTGTKTLYGKSDGTLTWGTKNIVRTVNGVAADAAGNVSISVANNAGAHNAVYRGADITARHADGSLSTQVQAGDFTDIFIGDYITATTTANGSTVTTKWRVADIDYYLRTGDTETTAHHLVLVPDVCMFNAYMNSTDTTAGGYQGSAMWKTYIPMCVTAIRNAFGSGHVLSWRTILSKAVNTNVASMAGAGWTGAASGWAWCDASADLMSEPQLYGTTVFSSSFFDVGAKKRQFALFRHDPARLNISAPFWLSAVSSGTNFAGCGSNGGAYDWGASVVVGVRPHFLYH